MRIAQNEKFIPGASATRLLFLLAYTCWTCPALVDIVRGFAATAATRISPSRTCLLHAGRLKESADRANNSQSLVHEHQYLLALKGGAGMRDANRDHVADCDSRSRRNRHMGVLVVERGDRAAGGYRCRSQHLARPEPRDRLRPAIVVADIALAHGQYCFVRVGARLNVRPDLERWPQRALRETDATFAQDPLQVMCIAKLIVCEIAAGAQNSQHRTGECERFESQSDEVEKCAAACGKHDVTGE